MKLLIVYLVVYLPTNLTLNDMQISEYDFTNEIGEFCYTCQIIVRELSWVNA